MEIMKYANHLFTFSYKLVLFALCTIICWGILIGVTSVVVLEQKQLNCFLISMRKSLHKMIRHTSSMIVAMEIQRTRAIFIVTLLTAGANVIAWNRNDGSKLIKHTNESMIRFFSIDVLDDVKLLQTEIKNWVHLKLHFILPHQQFLLLKETCFNCLSASRICALFFSTSKI